eukprot:gene12414-biopygen9126
MDFYGVHEIERHGTVTAGVCANPWVALQCCLEVRESATMLGAASVAGLAAERGQKRMASAPPGVGVGRRGSTTSLPPIQVIGTAKVDLSCKRSEVLRGEGVPYATPAYDGAAGPGAEGTNAARGPQVREIRRRRASSVAVPHTLNVAAAREHGPGDGDDGEEERASVSAAILARASALTGPCDRGGALQ